MTSSSNTAVFDHDLDSRLREALEAYDAYDAQRQIVTAHLGEGQLSLLQTRMQMRGRFLDLDLECAIGMPSSDADDDDDALLASLTLTPVDEQQWNFGYNHYPSSTERRNSDPAYWWTPAPPRPIFHAQQQFRSAVIASLELVRLQKIAMDKACAYEKAVLEGKGKIKNK
eukprot:PhM_4_TR8556/c0_g1_i1/m.35233